MDLLGGVFVLSALILVLVSILLGFAICNSITREKRDEGQRGGDNLDETQLDGIERKLDRLVRSSKFSWGSSFYIFGVTVVAAGFSLTSFKPLMALILVAVGLLISVMGLFFLLRYGLFAKRYLK